MITFNKIRYKNFLSTGDVFTEIFLDASPNTLIIGENGSGKSTILDALTFSLFGKPFRKVNKANVVNSINQKNCVVEIEFTTNGKKYKIVRGAKPNVFEIWCDGTMLNKVSSSRDYQEHLEKFVLKMGYKSFCQIVILGSASFVPFMQLTPADRRMIVEDLLDIQVFSVMGSVVKGKLAQNKEEILANKIEHQGKVEKKSFVERNIESLRSNNELKKRALQDELTSTENSIDTLSYEIESLNQQVVQLVQDTKGLEKLRKKHSNLVVLQTKVGLNRKKHLEEHKFYDTNSSCPTCRQNIDESFKESEVARLKQKLVDFDAGLQDIAKKIESCSAEISRLVEIQSVISQKQIDITSKQSTIQQLQRRKKEITKSIDTIDSSDTTLTENLIELEQIEQELVLLENTRNSLAEDRKYIETAASLLKDGGIKSQIIKQYLPIINKMINKYLTQMGFFASFHINENFEEVIKARHLEEFGYQNFSEGEKTRIDLAILFTWRHIAKLRNSVNCNLLIFDEIFDGSLDASGTDEFLKIMWNLAGDTNVFVISHKRDQLLDKFKRAYLFEKKRNFSCVVNQ